MGTTKVDVTTADGIADAYLTRPDDGSDQPAVLFLMDAFGLRPQIEEMTERIAARGYTVLAPNTLYRAGRTPVVPIADMTDPDDRAAFMQAVMPLMSQLTAERLARDGAAYLDFLDTVAPGPVAITGYCMGGRVGWRIATTSADHVVALGVFHGGGLVTDAPDSPHLSAPDLRAEAYFGHADQDQSMTAENIAALEKALDEAGARYRSEVYEGALHGYSMNDKPVYNEAAAERHYTELFALLDRTLPPS